MDDVYQKKLLLDSILENTQAQTRAIEEDELEALETLIARREDIMKQVDELDQKVATMTPEISKRVAGSIKELLSQIIAIDNVNQSRMKQEIGNVQTELRKIRAGRQQEERYGTEYGSYKEESIFFDTKEYHNR